MDNEGLIDKIIKDNIDVLKAIGELDKNFGDITHTVNAGEKAEGMAGTTNGINQLIENGLLA